MPLDRFLIAPINNGIQGDVEPWLLMNDAFASLQNVHSWRGRVIKRYGARPMNTSVDESIQQLFTRFRVNVGTTDPETGNFGPAVMPGSLPGKIGEMFSIGDVHFNVVVANGDTLTTDPTITATYNTATKTVTITGNGTTNLNTAVYWYPALPVMALPTYNTADINDETLFGFDTQFAYQYSQATGWQRLAAGGASAVWTGTNSDFHWATNYRGVEQANFYLWVTNNVAADFMRYWDGTQWNTFNPAYNNAGETIVTCKIIIGFNNRLLLMNTTEEQAAGPDLVFQNRIRYSNIDDPLDADAFNEDTLDAGFVESDVKEAIISAGIVKGHLIIWFENSTRELVYTGNPAQPFILQTLNIELGVESQNSVVPFDKVAIGFGSTGIHACNGVNVERVDQIIPDAIFDIYNENNGPERVCGIRDYFTQEVYWSFNSVARATTNAEIFPNRTLVYNYMTGSWAYNDDSITAFGYYQNEQDLTWESADFTWESTDDVWDDGSNAALFRNIVAGNQEGFTYIIDNEKASNAMSLSITNMVVAGQVITFTVTDHNLKVGDFIYVTNCQGIVDVNERIVRVYSVSNTNQFTVIFDDVATGTYSGGGTITLVSRVSILTKQYNFYTQAGKRQYIPRVNLLIAKTSDDDENVNGQFSFQYFESFSKYDIARNGLENGAILGSNIIEMGPLTNAESTQDKLWRYIYPLLEGDTIQFLFYYSDEQMGVNEYVFDVFELHAMLFYAKPTSDFGF